MRVLVCGGRNFAIYSPRGRNWDGTESDPGRQLRGSEEEGHLFRTMNELHARTPVDLLIHGGAYGADACAGRWAARVAIPCLSVPAQWDRYGSKAGPIRNARMLEEWSPDLVVAFPGGAGTADMVARAKAAGVKVMEVEELT